MTGRELEAREHTAETRPEQEPKGSAEDRDPKNPPVLQSKVSPEVRREVEDAVLAFEFDSLAEGVRLVMKAFARSPAVRDAVRQNLGVAFPDSRPASAA